MAPLRTYPRHRVADGAAESAGVCLRRQLDRLGTLCNLSHGARDDRGAALLPGGVDPRADGKMGPERPPHTGHTRRIDRILYRAASCLRLGCNAPWQRIAVDHSV